MTDLRAACIEEMAKAWVAYEGDEWDDINSRGMAAIRACVEREFDAVLDTLADRADEARAEVYELWAAAPTESGDMLTDLIAVLRGDTE